MHSLYFQLWKMYHQLDLQSVQYILCLKSYGRGIFNYIISADINKGTLENIYSVGLIKDFGSAKVTIASLYIPWEMQDARYTDTNDLSISTKIPF